ncbi:hypothetical protein CGCA056_v008986 [Colletotrichum aenigma]|uniref:uncharacterized protein n=1 Tax=Colletotrichum aenigma TaxID=1215731 RepID=UPI001872AC27|nr:uncharacterized protein CGCA056_v008986 [Colletotrichum aenigma]KAF5519843.1 hypothetical protein CGCA056_v008986 [Colletotrichum aenigma]
MSEQRLVFHPRHSLAFPTDFIYNAVKIDDAGDALEAVCRILSGEAKVHASRDTSSQTLDQATYLVGWHDAIHSLRNFILARRDFHMNKNTHIHGVPMCMSLPPTATIPEAAVLVASRGTASVFNIPEVPLFAPNGAEKQADDGFIVVSSSSATPFNTPTTSSFLQNSSSGPTAQDSQLQTSNILAGMDTKTILMNYEREARDSEQRIATEMAKMSLMRQAIFKDRFFGDVPSFLDNGGSVNKKQQARAVDAVDQIFRRWRGGQMPPTTRPSHTEPAVRNLGLFGGALRNLQNRPIVPQSPGNAGTIGGPPFFSPSQLNNTSQAPPRSQPSLFNYASMQSTAPRSQPNPTPPAPLQEWQLDQLLQDRNDTRDLKELWQSYQPGPSFIERNGVLLPPPDATPSAGSSKSVGSSGPPQTFGRRLGSCAISHGGQRQSRSEPLARSSIFHITHSTPSTIPTSTQGTLSHTPRQQPASSSSSMVPSQDVSEREMEAMYREGDRLLDLDAGSRTTADRSTRRSQVELAHQVARDLRARVRARRAREQAQTYTPESSDSLMTAPSPTSSSTEPAELDAFGTELAPRAAAPTPPSRPSLFEKALSPEEYNPAPVRGGPASGRGGLFGEALYNPAPARGNATDNTSIPKAAAPAPGRSGVFGDSARMPYAGGGLFGTSPAPSQQAPGPSGMFGSQLSYHSTREESSRRSTDEEEDP